MNFSSSTVTESIFCRIGGSPCTDLARGAGGVDGLAFAAKARRTCVKNSAAIEPTGE